MKNKKILFLLPFLFLTGCGKGKSFEEKVIPIKDNLKMEGTISYKFYDENNQPTANDPVTSAVNVLFTNTGYEISYKGEFDQNLTETLFKSERNTVELRYINNLNELVVECPKNDEGAEFDFTPYTNPFGLITAENIVKEKDEKSASFDLTNAMPTAIDFVARLTYYKFPELQEVSFMADKDMVTGVHIVTPILKETMRSGVYTFDLNVVAFGEEVTGPVTPEPAVPNEKQALLQAALEELVAQDYQATLMMDFGYMVYNMGLYKNSQGLLCTDKDDPRYSIGFFKSNDQMYEVTYDRTLSSFVKSVSTTMTETDLIPTWLLFSTVLYDVSEDGKEFTVSSTIDASMIGQYGYLLTLGNCAEMMGATSMTMKLDDQNHLASVSFTSEYEMFVSATITIDSIGSCAMPFDDVANLPDLPATEA